MAEPGDERMRTRRREETLQNCQERLEYMAVGLQDCAIELGDGRGAIWIKTNRWFLNKPAEFFDDILFSVGKICNLLESYMTFHKQKLLTHFPFMTYMRILYEVGDVLSIIRDMLLLNPQECLSKKQNIEDQEHPVLIIWTLFADFPKWPRCSECQLLFLSKFKTQIDLFWGDCTPFLFVFDNYTWLNKEQTQLYLQALLDLVPAVIQVGLCMYCCEQDKLRKFHFEGFEFFADTCLKLSRAMVETGEFLSVADNVEPVITPFLRQWILYALELVQYGAQSMNKEDDESTACKTIRTPLLTSESSIPDEVAEASMAPLKIFHGSQVRASCQPFKWIEIARARVTQCPVDKRKRLIEDIGLRENQKLISEIFIFAGPKPNSWHGVKLHCPLTKAYDELKVNALIKVKRGDDWIEQEAKYEFLHGKGNFLTFSGCELDGFVAIEARPMVTKDIDKNGGSLSTSFDNDPEATIPKSVFSYPRNLW